MIDKLMEHTVCRWFGHEIDFSWYSFDDNTIHEKCKRCGHESKLDSVESSSAGKMASYGYQFWL